MIEQNETDEDPSPATMELYRGYQTDESYQPDQEGVKLMKRVSN